MDNFYSRFLKRIIDLIFSVTALLLFTPLLIATALLIYIDDGVPVLFRQLRSGKDGKTFTLFKFRSMPVNSKNVPSNQAGSLRVTRMGKFIRRYNIDELPQLINIVKGDMSIVGPRPALCGQTHLLDLRRANGAVSVKPGLTGLAQINSYDGMSDEEKADFDGAYVKRMSFRTDSALILRTFAYLLKPPPVY